MSNTFTGNTTGPIWASTSTYSMYNVGSIINSNNASLTITGDNIVFAPTNNKNAVIKTNKNEIDLDVLYETVQLLAERLAVLAVDADVLAKHPTLRDAYEQYQLLNVLIKPKKDNNDHS
jgi:hypothetical protein